MDLYVYYKVRELDGAALAPRVRAMQAALSARHGIAARLQRRPESKDGLQTWMEVYPGASGAFAADLEAAAAGLEALMAGPRRTETFVDIPAETSPCA